MITSIFRKSTPINYFLVTVILLGAFFLHQNQLTESGVINNTFLQKVGVVGVFLASLFLVNFIVKRNELTKNSSYAILFFVLLLILFPSVFDRPNLLLANLFLLLSFRRLISMQNLKFTKEKIFDASFWIIIASLFHFWCILFIFLVYISIIFHASRDYRNWLIPFVAFFGVVTIFMLASVLFDYTWIDYIVNRTEMNFQLDYFTNNIQNLALAVYLIMSIFFVFSMIFSLTNRPLVLQASFQKIVFGFFIGVVVFLISIAKSNAMLVFTFFPLAVMCTSNLEYSKSKLYQEIVLSLFIVAGFLSFFSQL